MSVFNSEYRTRKELKSSYANNLRRHRGEMQNNKSKKYGGDKVVIVGNVEKCKLTPLQRLPYKEYLHTKHWKTISNECKRRASHRCQLCGSNEELHAHHRTYEHKGNFKKEILDLICICKTCHSIFHQKI